MLLATLCRPNVLIAGCVGSSTAASEKDSADLPLDVNDLPPGLNARQSWPRKLLSERSFDSLHTHVSFTDTIVGWESPKTTNEVQHLTFHTKRKPKYELKIIHWWHKTIEYPKLQGPQAWPPKNKTTVTTSFQKPSNHLVAVWRRCLDPQTKNAKTPRRLLSSPSCSSPPRHLLPRCVFVWSKGFLVGWGGGVGLGQTKLIKSYIRCHDTDEAPGFWDFLCFS